jgi:2-haloacid dehalogenase
VGPTDERLRPAAIAFDLYGTLLDVGSLTAACAAEVPVAEAGRFVELWRQKQLEYSWLRAHLGRYEDFWQVTADALDNAAARLGVRLSDAARQRLMDAWLELRPYPEVESALGEFDVPLFVVSNGSPRMLQEVLARAALAPRFEALLSVDAVRTYKPAPAVYAMAEREIARPRKSILFVSANGWDVAGAQTFGFPVAWVNRSELPAERLGITPDIMVPNVTAIRRVVFGAGAGETQNGAKTMLGG